MSRSAAVLSLMLAGPLASLGGCSPAKYLAQPASVEETRDTVRQLKVLEDQLAKRIGAIEKELAATNERLAGNNANLNAELGTMTETLASLSDRMNDLSAQLERRAIRKAPVPSGGGEQGGPYDTAGAVVGEAGGPALPPADAGGLAPAPPTPVAGPPVAGALSPDSAAGRLPADPAVDPEEVYDAAYRDISRGSYDLAVAGFAEFLRLFPEHDLADNAQYWIGECYYVRNEPERARQEFLKVLDQYPQGDKVPAASLKLGYCALKLNNPDEARRCFDELIRRFPRSEEARSARQKLASMP